MTQYDCSQVLGALTDPASQQRVLKWAAERFAVEGALAPLEADSAPVPAVDAALAVDSLDDMFVMEVEPIVDDDLGEFAGPGPKAAPVRDAPKPPLEAVIRSFAADFQRFTEEWNGATA